MGIALKGQYAWELSFLLASLVLQYSTTVLQIILAIDQMFVLGILHFHKYTLAKSTERFTSREKKTHTHSTEYQMLVELRATLLAELL